MSIVENYKLLLLSFLQFLSRSMNYLFLLGFLLSAFANEVTTFPDETQIYQDKQSNPNPQYPDDDKYHNDNPQSQNNPGKNVYVETLTELAKIGKSAYMGYMEYQATQIKIAMAFFGGFMIIVVVFMCIAMR